MGEPTITVLAGGVGGAKLVLGLAGLAEPERVTVVGNVGDDVERHGLWVSPDMDIVTYTLAGVVDEQKHWGIAGDTFHALGALERLGEPVWMNLGDQDLATHILRTDLRRRGVRPTEIARRIAERLGATIRVLPPTDDRVQTRIRTDAGWLGFQEYFVRDRCEATVREVAYDGAERARITPEAEAALTEADVVIIAPSNPICSIGPILAVPGVREALSGRRAPRVTAISPIVGGYALKGPAAAMLESLGYGATPLGVARCYGELVDSWVIDQQDRELAAELEAAGYRVKVTDTVMTSLGDKEHLAREVIAFAAGSAGRAGASRPGAPTGGGSA